LGAHHGAGASQAEGEALTPVTEQPLSAKEIALRYISFLEEQVKTLQRRQWVFIMVALGGYGLAGAKQAGWF